MAITYNIAVWKLLNDPVSLRPEDISALRARNPWLAKAAVTTWEMSIRQRDYNRKWTAPVDKRSLPVVKILRGRR